MSQSTLNRKSDTDVLVIKLREVMGLSDLSVEELLARFMSRESLSRYCVSVLGKSGKGTTPVLAGRIQREWRKPSFDPHKTTTTLKTIKKKTKKRIQI